MPAAKQGDTVKVHYTGRLEDGTVVESSRDREPVQFTIGTGEVIRGIEEAVTGMRPGESQETKIPAERAYGPYRRELVAVVDRAELPDTLSPKVGDRLKVNTAEGDPLLVKVTDSSQKTITIDANHELAGKPVIFDLELVAVI